jgi:aryl-alcohol dehydrogenase-like predicted oxidoreductase
MNADRETVLGSPIAIGTARGAEDDQTDDRMRAVLLSALTQGITVFDTAGNYRRGRSEKVVGEAVRHARHQGIVHRSQVTVISKGGYLRPPGGPIPMPPPPEPHCLTDHCLSPACLRHQLEVSLQTLCLDYINVYLLHNPETQRAGRRQEEFDRLILEAFAVLEDAVAKREIKAYGIATWRSNGGSEDAVPIARCKALSAQVAPGDDHFDVVQAPLSLANQAALAPTHEVNGRHMSLPDLCKHLGLSFVASAAAGGGKVTAIASSSVRWVASVPGVTTALVGTLNPFHLDELVEILQNRATSNER